MNLAQAQKSLAYITLVVAMIVLVIAGVIGTLGLVALPVAVIVSWFWEPTPAGIERQRALWNVTLLGFIALTAWKVLVGGVAVLQPAVDLVLVLVVAKLFQRASARDYTQIYALTFLMVAVATVLDDGLHFGVLLGVYLIFCAGGFTVNQIAARTEGTRTPAHTIRVPARYVAMLAAMSALLMLMSAGFFVLLPRVGIGMGAASTSGEPTKMTGFSDSIDLSDHGALGLDETIVLRAELDSPPGALYWRGISFDRFDGRRWSISPELRRRREIDASNGRFELPAPRPDDARGPLPDGTARLRQEIELEPLDADVLLGLPRIAAVAYPSRGDSEVTARWHDVSVDRTGSVYHGFGPRQRVHYIVESQPEPFDTTPGTGYDPEQPLPPMVARYYLTLPRLSKRVRRLAVELARGTDDPMEMARRIERHLATQYDYTLELPRRGRDPIDNFLFDDRRGHCEFFSTSMVVLLRAVGVPARNVNGFQGGEYNEVGDYWIVRRMHAHSWVEVWVPGLGWRTFDPTPEMGLPEQRAAAADEGQLGVLDGWLDQLRRLWRGWVLDYDLRRQLSLFGVGDDDGGSSAEGGLAGRLVDGLLTSWWRWLLVAGWLVLVGVALRRVERIWPTALLGWAGGVVLCQLLWPVPALLPTTVVTMVVVWLTWRLRISTLDDQEVATSAPVSRVYLAVVAALRRRETLADVDRLGPEQLARRLDRGDTDLDRELADFARRYARLRFGPTRASPQAVRELRRQGRRLRRALRRGMA